MSTASSETISPSWNNFVNRHFCTSTQLHDFKFYFHNCFLDVKSHKEWYWPASPIFSSDSSIFARLLSCSPSVSFPSSSFSPSSSLLLSNFLLGNCLRAKKKEWKPKNYQKKENKREQINKLLVHKMCSWRMNLQVNDGGGEQKKKNKQQRLKPNTDIWLVTGWINTNQSCVLGCWMVKWNSG